MRQAPSRANLDGPVLLRLVVNSPSELSSRTHEAGVDEHAESVQSLRITGPLVVELLAHRRRCHSE